MKAAIRDKREKMIAAGAEKNYILVRSLRAEIKTMEAALCKVEKGEDCQDRALLKD